MKPARVPQPGRGILRRDRVTGEWLLVCPPLTGDEPMVFGLDVHGEDGKQAAVAAAGAFWGYELPEDDGDFAGLDASKASITFDEARQVWKLWALCETCDGFFVDLDVRDRDAWGQAQVDAARRLAGLRRSDRCCGCVTAEVHAAPPALAADESYAYFDTSRGQWLVLHGMGLDLEPLCLPLDLPFAASEAEVDAAIWQTGGAEDDLLAS